ncbi:MAG TPA: hypothetical protein DCZ72_00265 [Armatimonadetes bacterium]|nr:hypothetical protein [Armatimonadota bacterium]
MVQNDRYAIVHLLMLVCVLVGGTVPCAANSVNLALLSDFSTLIWRPLTPTETADLASVDVGDSDLDAMAGLATKVGMPCHIAEITLARLAEVARPALAEMHPGGVFALIVGVQGDLVQLRSETGVVVIPLDVFAESYTGRCLVSLGDFGDDTVPGPRVLPDSVDVELGPVPIGQARMVEFVLRNAGTVPLELRSGGSSCEACLVVLAETLVVPPGEQTAVTVRFRATGFGRQGTFATLLTNDPGRKVLYYTVRAVVPAGVVVRPNDISVATYAGATVERSVLLQLPAGVQVTTSYSTPASLQQYTASRATLVQAAESATDDGTGNNIAVWELRWTFTAPDEARELRGSLVAETDSTAVGTVSVPMHLTVLSDLEAVPKSIVVRGLQVGVPYETAVVVRHRRAYPFDVVEVSADRDEVTVLGVQPLNDGGYEVRVRITAAQVGPLSAHLELRTSLQGEPSLRVPLSAWVLAPDAEP